MPNNLPSINFVKNKQAPLFDRFLNWALTVGRLIVIITEIVAVAAFVYRFSLDEKLVNIHSAIKQKGNIVSVLKNDEAKFRNLQDRIALAADSSTKAAKSNQTIIDIINFIPKEVTIDDFLLNKDRVTLGINVVATSSLENFVNSLKNYPNIKSINIDNIENRPSAGLSVDMTAMLK